MTKRPKSQQGMAWRVYPPKPKGTGQQAIRIHDVDWFSCKPPSEAAARVIAKVLAHKPAKPPGVR